MICHILQETNKVFLQKRISMPNELDQFITKTVTLVK